MANTNLTNQRQVFVDEYVRSGDHLEAAKKAGYKDTHTLRNQACKLRRECADQITEELHRNFAEIAPRALNMLSDLAENAESESVRFWVLPAIFWVELRLGLLIDMKLSKRNHLKNLMLSL